MGLRDAHILRLLPLALAFAALAPAGTAHAAKHMEVALSDDAVFVRTAYYDRPYAFFQAAPLAVTRLRLQLTWATVLRNQAKRRKAPAHPKYNFRRLDEAIDNAAARGIRVQLLVSGPAPAFATSNKKIGPMRPSPKHYGAFVRAVAKHFKGRVNRYSLWNEPNHRSWLAPLKKSGTLYRRLYLAGYRAVKAADPKANVLIGETAPYNRGTASIPPLRFLRQAVCVTKSYRPHRDCRRQDPAPGGALRADGYAHHPYDFLHGPTHRYKGSDNVTIGTLGRLTKALDRMRRARALAGPRKRKLNLYLSEFGYFAKGEWSVGEKLRAKYLPKAFALAQRNPRVVQLLQYGLVSPPSSYPGAFFDLALVSRDGKERRAYRALSKWVAKAVKQGKVARRRGKIRLPKARSKPRSKPKPPPQNPSLLPTLPFPP